MEEEAICYFICPRPDEGAIANAYSDFLFNEIIYPVCRELNIRAMRADHIKPTGRVADQIMETLQNADFVAAEVSGESRSVAYEIGARKASGRPLITFIHDSTMGSALDSVADLRHLIYVQGNLAENIPAKKGFRDFLTSHRHENSPLKCTSPNPVYIEQSVSTPASDRYVSVRDNQVSFDELYEQLSRVKNEYARDHNRLAAEPSIEDLIAEIDATQAQIRSGRVRLGQLNDGLLPSFERSCLALSAYPGMVLAIQQAMATAQDILRFFGIL